jgi:hypothetical protein
MNITSKKTYQSGDKVIAILTANSYLERGKEYTVKRFEYGEVYLEDDEQDGYPYNPARFISTAEIRDSKIEKILQK